MSPSAQGPSLIVGARKFVPPFLVICAGLYAYHNSLHAPFIFDDLDAITGNPTIRRLWPPWRAMSPPPDSPVTGRPIVNLSLAVNYTLDGLNVWGYHVFNLAIHILVALVLYGIVQRTLRGPSLRSRHGNEAPWLALAVALVWVVHPLQTDSVTYITQRTELLMGLFFLLTLYCVIRGAESSGSGVWYAAAVVFTVLGMGSKEVMAVAPVVVLAYDRLFLSRSFHETFWRRRSLYAGLAATWLIFAALVQTRMGTDIAILGSTEVTPWDYAKTQSGVIVHYLRLSLWPDPLVADYDDWPLAKSATTILPSAALAITLLCATLWTCHRRLPVAFLGVWFFLILAPTSSFWPIVTEIAAERRMYLPLAAVIVPIVIGGHMVLREICCRLRWRTVLQRSLEAAVVVTIVTTLAHITVRRNEDYRSTESFWSDVAAKRPNNARGHVGLGDALARQGKFEEAFAHYSKALRINPDYALAHNDLGNALAQQGKFEEAFAHYSEALRIHPNYALAHNGLGNALAQQGKLEEAFAHYSKALRINPDYALAHNGLGNVLAQQGKLEEAFAHYSEALRINPDYALAHNGLGNALAQQGKLEEAIAHYSEALRINPDYALAHYNLGITLAREGKIPEAIRHLEVALKLDPAFQQARRVLEELKGAPTGLPAFGY